MPNIHSNKRVALGNNKRFGTFTSIGKNKFDKNNYINNFELTNLGVSFSFTGSAHTDFIPITEGALIVSLSGFTPYTGTAGFICFYDSTQTYISRGNMPTTFVEGLFRIPDNAKFLRANIVRRPTGTEVINYNTIQIEWWQKSAYTPYVVNTEKAEVDNSGSKIYNLNSGKNFFNKDAYLLGYRYDNGDNTPGNSGALITTTFSSQHACTNYLTVPTDAQFVYLSGFSLYAGNSSRRINYLDANKLFIKFDYFNNTDSYTMNVLPSNCRYLVISLYEYKTGSEIIDLSTIQIEFYGETTYSSFSEALVKTSAISLADTKAYGRKVLVFGDSIMETSYNWDVAPPAYTEGGRPNWITMLRGYQKFGYTRNYAGSGARYRNVAGLSNRQKIDFQITTAIAQNPTTDIIIICCGTNDAAPNSTDLGSFATAMGKSTLAALDKTKYYESIRWAFWSLKTAYPNAIVFVGNVLPRADLANSVYDDNNLAIQLMAAQYGFIYVNQRDNAGVNRANETWGANGVDLVDGLHPNHNGWLKIGNYWNGILNSYL